MGLSQAKLGELVGRSASTIRSWERDDTVPNDEAVIDALSAVLGIDKYLLYSKAGMEIVPHETSPTVEEALATLSPAATIGDIPSQAAQPIALDDEADDDSQIEQSEAEDGEESIADQWLRPFPEEVPPEPDPLWPTPPPHLPVATPPPGYIAPRGSLVYAAARPPVVEPSYIEDENQRQVYRIRNLATMVLVVALVVVLVWAMGNAWDSFSTWWDDFFGQLRL
jgi:transcriptional regulator with XRE-family HTH domain